MTACTVFPEIKLCSICARYEKGNSVAVKTPIASVKTVEVEKTVKATEKQYTLTLNEQQAGYLIDLLCRHVAGEVVSYLLVPLADALLEAGAARLNAHNDNRPYRVSYPPTSTGFATRYAVLKFSNDAAREAAGVPKPTIY